MTKRLLFRVLLVAGFAAFANTPVLAECSQKRTAETSVIDLNEWRDMTKFAFRIGRDFSSRSGRPEIIRRFEKFGSSNQLRKRLGDWDKEFGLVEQIHARRPMIRSAIGRLDSICKELDAHLLDEANINRPSVKLMRADAIEKLTQLDRILRKLTDRTHTFHRLLTAAASYYDGSQFKPNQYLSLGPTPARASQVLDRIYDRVRTAHSDIAEAITQLSQPLDFEGLDLLTEIEDARALVQSASSQIESLTSDLISRNELNSLLAGEHLYAECPVPENQFIMLGNDWYKKDNGFLTSAGTVTMIIPRLRPNSSALFNSFFSSSTQEEMKRAQFFKFVRAGLGWYHIIPRSDETKMMDVLNSSSKNYELRATETNNGVSKFSGQFWRCIRTERGRSIRLSNLFLGEAMSADTYRNNTTVIMTGTLNSGAQYWSVIQP